MIAVEEKTRERFPERGFQERGFRDNPDRQNTQDRKRSMDNMIATTDYGHYDPRRLDAWEKTKCVWHPNSYHLIGNCRIFNERYSRKNSRFKKEYKKEAEKEKKEENKADNGFQMSKGEVAVIFFRCTKAGK